MTSLILLGCAATKPNISIIDEKYKSPRLAEADQNFLEAKVILNQISSRNNLLAIELGKLPELQDGVTNREKQALETLLDLYQNNPRTFDDAFSQMYQIGLPEVRRYCSPLQALFWLLEANEYAPEKSSLGYDLQTLLFRAWDFSEKDRWSNFKVVTDRLNAPELINFYERSQFRYSRGPRYSRGFRYNMTPQEVFFGKTGHCEAITAFTVYCLGKSGYKARLHRVPSPTGYYKDHAVTLFEWNGDKYIMDNGRPFGRGIVPFGVYSPK